MEEQKIIERVYVISQLENRYIDVKGVYKSIEDVHRWINNNRLEYFIGLIKEPDYRMVASINEVFLVEKEFTNKEYYDLKTEIRNITLNKFYEKGIDVEPYNTVARYIEENPQENWWAPTQEEFDKYIEERKEYTRERDLCIKKDKDEADYQIYLELKTRFG